MTNHEDVQILQTLEKQRHFFLPSSINGLHHLIPSQEVSKWTTMSGFDSSGKYYSVLIKDALKSINNGEELSPLVSYLSQILGMLKGDQCFDIQKNISIWTFHCAQDGILKTNLITLLVKKTCRKVVYDPETMRWFTVHAKSIYSGSLKNLLGRSATVNTSDVDSTNQIHLMLNEYYWTSYSKIVRNPNFGSFLVMICREMVSTGATTTWIILIRFDQKAIWLFKRIRITITHTITNKIDLFFNFEYEVYYIKNHLVSKIPENQEQNRALTSYDFTGRKLSDFTLGNNENSVLFCKQMHGSIFIVVLGTPGRLDDQLIDKIHILTIVQRGSMRIPKELNFLIGIS